MNMAILWDTECTAKYFYILNSRKLRIKVLKEENMQNIDMKAGQHSLPMVIDPMVKDIDTLNSISTVHLTYQLAANDLEGLCLLSDCTE